MFKNLQKSGKLQDKIKANLTELKNLNQEDEKKNADEK